MEIQYISRENRRKASTVLQKARWTSDVMETLFLTKILHQVIPQNQLHFGQGWRLTGTPSAPFIFLEIFSRTKHQNKTTWIVPPGHHWYQCSRPEGSLAHGFKRQDQTLLTCFRSGHLKTMKFSEGCKSFEMCTNCSSEPASPAHILKCLGLIKQDLADDTLLVLDFLKVYKVMNLV
ncbi:uncharacterized protein TNCV_2696021 [Trichonephila clavipes]|nr:uncharacterized protein TNCV_2696021 [Trichonephila clavipes]